MSDIAIGRQKAGNPFQAGAIALMLVLGILGFVGLLVLGAYAPDMRSGRNGGGHALSNSATGFSAIVQLARATGRNPHIIRSEHDFETESLLILTPEDGTVDLTDALSQRTDLATLVVLPKWQTKASETRNGWVEWVGLQPTYVPEMVLTPDIDFTMAQYRSGGAPLVTHELPGTIRLRAPRPLQVITGLKKPKPEDQAKKAKPGQVTVLLPTDADEPLEDVAENAVQAPDAKPHEHSITPIITDGHGGIILARIDDQPLYVLADPDLLANRGMQDVRQAQAVLAVLDWMNGDPKNGPKNGIAFDVSFNGFGHSKSPLRLLFEPPFLAMTICVAVALLLAGAQAFGRFGPPRARERAIAFGKAALVDNSAALIRKAGRESRMGGRYAAVIRERAIAIFAISSRLRDGALDAYLDKLKGKHRFTDLVAAAEAAENREELLAAAQALHIWQKEKIG